MTDQPKPARQAVSTPNRDELAAIIREAHLQWVLDGDAPDDAMPEWAADAIIAAGWSPTENREAAPDAFTDPDVTRICPTGCKERSPHRHERRGGKDWVLPAPTHNRNNSLHDLADQAAKPWFRRVCIGGDATCPCQDGDLCHYEGDNPWPIPTPTHNETGGRERAEQVGPDCSGCGSSLGRCVLAVAERDAIKCCPDCRHDDGLRERIEALCDKVDRSLRAPRGITFVRTSDLRAVLAAPTGTTPSVRQVAPSLGVAGPTTKFAAVDTPNGLASPQCAASGVHICGYDDCALAAAPTGPTKTERVDCIGSLECPARVHLHGCFAEGLPLLAAPTGPTTEGRGHED